MKVENIRLAVLDREVNPFPILRLIFQEYHEYGYKTWQRVDAHNNLIEYATPVVINQIDKADFAYGDMPVYTTDAETIAIEPEPVSVLLYKKDRDRVPGEIVRSKVHESSPGCAIRLDYFPATLKNVEGIVYLLDGQVLYAYALKLTFSAGSAEVERKIRGWMPAKVILDDMEYPLDKWKTVHKLSGKSEERQVHYAIARKHGRDFADLTLPLQRIDRNMPLDWVAIDEERDEIMQTDNAYLVKGYGKFIIIPSSVYQGTGVYRVVEKPKSRLATECLQKFTKKPANQEVIKGFFSRLPDELFSQSLTVSRNPVDDVRN